MCMSNISDTKKIGRPATGVGKPITVRLNEADLAALDSWIAGQEDEPTRPEAVRKLMRLGMTAQGT